MTSAINPNNINGAYPVAGQDNNSQGFRDNFTNTKTNFQYAADEITALQNSAILAANLANSAPVVNDLLTSTLTNGFLQDMYLTRVALGTPDIDDTIAIDFSAGSYQTVTTSGANPIAFSNWPASGAAATVSVQITVDNSSHTIILPAAVSINNAGIQGLLPSTNTITFAATGVYTFTFTTSDAGSTIIVNETNKQLQPFNNSQEDLDNAAAISLTTGISNFTTAGAETATLADGAEGQVKTLICTGYVGDMVVTVANAGWVNPTGSGTITFNAKGDTCTLQFVQGAWYVIGSNSISLA